MRKSRFLLVSGVLSMFLVSCISHLRTNYFVEGLYYGVNSYNDKETYFLTVTEISRFEFIDANGKNVVNDIVSKKYYYLELYYINSDDEDTKYFIDFFNFKDVGGPVYYVDENISIIQSFYDEDFERNNEDVYYKAEIGKEQTQGSSDAFVYFREVKND